MRQTLLLATILLTPALAGCVADGEGSASVYVKDAPTDEFEEIHVVFSDAYVHEGDDNETDENESDNEAGDGGGPSTEGGPSSQGDRSQADFRQHGDRGGGQASEEQFREEAGWIPLVETDEPIDVDLLDATGARAAFLGEANLSAGTYTQIAIVVDDAYAIDEAGDRTNVTVPSGVGRIVQSFQVESGQETQIILDLDLDRAMTEANSEWRLTPVFGQTETRIVDGTESGEDVHEPGEISEVQG